MCEDFLISNTKIKKICPHCNSCKVEIIKKGIYTNPFTVLFSINNEEKWGALKRSFAILRCLNCFKVFKFHELFTFTAFSENDLKDEKGLILDSLNGMSLETIVKTLNKALLLLNEQPFNRDIWNKLEMIFFKLKNDKIKIIIEIQEELNKTISEISFFSFYSVLSAIRKEKTRFILCAKYEQAAELRDIEKLYQRWRKSKKLLMFLYKKHFFIKSNHLITFVEPLNPYLKVRIINILRK